MEIFKSWTIYDKVLLFLVFKILFCQKTKDESKDKSSQIQENVQSD